MTHDQPQARTYGGWRRSRSIGLLGLGPAAAFVLLGVLVALVLVAAVSLKAFLYAAPPAAAVGAASLLRAGGVPLAQVAVQQLRWWQGTCGGYTGYRAEVVLRHTGTLQLPGTLAATELLSAEDGSGRHYGIVRDRRAGFLTATLRVAPISTWLADRADADSWVANWAGWLASLGYVPALRWVTVTVDTAPDPGCTLAGQVAAAIDPAAPQAARQIIGQLVATAAARLALARRRTAGDVRPGAADHEPHARPRAARVGEPRFAHRRKSFGIAPMPLNCCGCMTGLACRHNVLSARRRSRS